MFVNSAILFLSSLFFFGTARAEVAGTYIVKGQLLQPVFEDCEFDLDIRVAANQFAMSAFTCGHVDFPGFQVSFRAGTLRDNSGRGLGAVTEDTLTYQGGGKTIHISLRDAKSGGFNYFGNGFKLHGELTKVLGPAVTASR